MLNTKNLRLSLVLGAVLLFAAPLAFADRGGRHGGQGRSSFGGSFRNSRPYVAPDRSYRPSYNGYNSGFSAGRFYPGRGYFYGGNFWARPYSGIGIGIPFGYGFNTNRGCGYVNNFGDFYPAPCYSRFSSRY